jgi:photosystem II stability/assembly factor-like uncharacterized protein
MRSNTIRHALGVAIAAFVAAVAASAPALGQGGVKVRSQIVEDLYDARFIDAREGWVVGQFGSIYHTTDGGRSWTAQATPTTQHLYGVAFADAKNGWAVGRGGEIVHTGDGGAHWTEQQSNTKKHLFKVCFLDPQEGWAVGDWGVALHTSDGGATWTDRSLGEDQIVYAVDFADRDNGWTAGEFGSIRHTADGGKTWTQQQTGTQKTFFGIAAVSKDRAWAVGIDGLVMRTRDGGATWELQQGEKDVASFESIGFMELLKNPGLYDVKIRGERGYVVGDVGNVLVTEDGGETWTKSLLPAEWRLSWVRGLSVLPSGEGMLVGAAGLTFWAEGKEMRFSQASL